MGGSVVNSVAGRLEQRQVELPVVFSHEFHNKSCTANAKCYSEQISVYFLSTKKYLNKYDLL